MPVQRRRPTPQQLELPNTQPSAIDSSTLRPGFLVGLKTSVSGNVLYTKEVIENEHRIRTGALRMAWQTERTITDPEEHKKASQARMKARQIISSVCAKSAFGLLCPKNQLPKLELAVREAERIVATFNRSARLTVVEVRVLKGEIANNDLEAIRSIKSEVRELLRDMSDGVQNLDVGKVREAANKARNIGSMLSPEAAEKIKGAIDAARSAARKITKAGETAAQEIDRTALTAIAQARTAFLDVDNDETSAEIGAIENEAREVDIDPGAVEDSDTANDNEPGDLETPSGANTEAARPRARPTKKGRFTGKVKAKASKKVVAARKAAVAKKRVRA